MRASTAILIVPALIAALVGCRRPAGDAAQPAPTPAGSEWTLVQLRGQPPPPGAAARPATLALTEPDHRVTGFAGCNRIAGSYEIAGDSLHVGPLIMTRMACTDGMDLEREYATALGAAQAWRITDGRLELLGADGVLAAFERR